MFRRADFTPGPSLSGFLKRIYREFYDSLKWWLASHSATVRTVHRPADDYPVGIR